jgi:uncharacterized membrane protein YedE/YeeE
MLSFTEISIALLIGGGTGLILQRGRVCANTGFRNIILANNIDIAGIFLIAVAVEMVGYLLLSSIDLFSFLSNPISLSLILTPVGGLIFGIGTVFAGGCAGGTCYRIGEGSLKAFIALLGFGIGIGISFLSPIGPILSDIRSVTELKFVDKVPSLEMFLPRWFWTIIIVIVAILFTLYLTSTQSKLTHLRHNWTPLVSGVLLGVVGILARIFSSDTGRNFGFSTTDGIGELFRFFGGLVAVLPPSPIEWAGFFIIGLILGSFISSFQLHEFTLKFPSKKDFISFFCGGFLLGFGAILAQGCNFGHILGGIPELGVSSLIATLFMILGNWIASYFIYRRLGQEIPSSTPKLALKMN